MWRFHLPERAEAGTLLVDVVDAPRGARVQVAAWASARDAAAVQDAGPVDPRWTRLSADDPAGLRVDATPIETLTTEVEPPPIGAVATRVGPGRAVAVNVVGPGATVAGAWWAADGSGPVRAAFTVRDASGQRTASAETFEAVGGLGPSTVTVALAPDEPPRLLRLWTLGARPVGWGGAPSFADGDGRAVGPEILRIPMVWVEPGAPASWPVRPGEILRIAARPTLRPGAGPGLGAAPPEGPPTTLTVRLVDAAGAEIIADGWDVARVPSAFEPLDGARGRDARIGEQRLGLLQVPDGAARLVVEAGAPAAVALAARVGDAAVRHPGYATPEGVRARFAPSVQAAFAARGPADPDALLAEGRLVDLLAQVRLEGAGAEPADSADIGVGGGGGSPVLVSSLRLDAPFHWLLIPSAGPGRDGRTRLGRAPKVVRAGPDGSLVLELRREPTRVAEPLRLVVDGSPRIVRPRASSAVFRLTGLPPRVALAVAEPGVFVVPDVDGEVRKVRAWRLRAGEQVRLPVPPDGGKLVVQAWGGGFDWRIDGDRVEGAIYDALPPVVGASGPGDGTTAIALTGEGGAAPARAPFRRRFDPATTERAVVLTATGDTWIRPLATWGAPGEDTESFWWLPETVDLGEERP